VNLSRTHLAAVAAALAAGTSLLTGCGTADEPEAKLVCGLVNPDLVDKVADGRRWREVGTLYHDGRFGDGCTVLASSEQLLTITLFNFRDRGATVAESVRAQVLEERTNLTRTCTRTAQAPITADQVSAACVREDKIRYAVANPHRLVRVSLARRFGVVPTTAAVERMAASINANADKVGQ
jgi:hypothetical protein